MAREKGLAQREHGEIESLEPWNTFRDMEKMFRHFFMSPLTMQRPSSSLLSEMRGDIVPEVDLKETDKEYHMSAIIPGLTKDDINIDVTENRITISGERKSEEERTEERYLVRQQSFGTFKVSYDLPSDVKPDDVKATYKNGILDIMIPKAEETKAHKVKVEAEEK